MDTMKNISDLMSTVNVKLKKRKEEPAESFVRLKAGNKMKAFFSVIPKINTLLSSDLGPAHQVYA